MSSRDLGREEVQTVSTGDSFEALVTKEQRSGSAGGKASDAGRVFNTDDMTTCLTNDRNDTVIRRK